METPRRVAAIDVGTNTVLLLIAAGSAASPQVLLERATITRLGEDTDRTGVLSDRAMLRTLRCLSDYAALAREHAVDALEVVCTSAARDATNGVGFLSSASHVLGVTPRIVDGREEAELAFAGALSGLPVEGEVTVFDVGGGSTEIIHGRAAGSAARMARGALAAWSLDVGSVRLTERHISTDPPRAEELRRVRADVRSALGAVPQPATTHLVGVAGTVTTLAAIDQGMSVYDPNLVHGSILTREAVVRLTRELAMLPLGDRRRISGLEPARADVIVAGALIVEEILEWAATGRIRVSDRGVRWGLALRALAAPQTPPDERARKDVEGNLLDGSSSPAKLVKI